jgi:4-hydroxy 2-oxovalerate aldolase
MNEWMDHPVAIMDVTLRDGGYVNDFGFTAADRQGVVAALAGACVPWLEIGYFAGREAGNGHPTFPAEEIPALHRLAAGRSRLVVMIHRGTVTAHDYEQLAEAGVAMIRLPLSLADRKYGPAIRHDVACIHACGMEVSLNVIRASEHQAAEILEFAEELDAMGPDWLYVADSNGSLFTPQVVQLYTLLAGRIRARLGFHAHDSLTLAFANSLAALQHGACIVDSSLGGMGKRGNLVSELIALYLDLHDGCRFDVPRMVQATEGFVVRWLGPSCLARTEMAIAGMLNLNHDAMLDLHAVARQGESRPLHLLLQRFTSELQEQLEHRFAGTKRDLKEAHAWTPMTSSQSWTRPSNVARR